MQTKSEVRKFIKTEFFNKNFLELQKQSNIICKKILDSKEYKQSSIVLVYNALKDEVCLELLINHLLKNNEQNKIICFPKVDSQTLEMDFFYKQKFVQKDFCSGYKTILEPNINSSWQILNPSTLKDKNVLVLVPGRAFTKEGIRLGRGKGFYDKYLIRLNSFSNKCFICGVAFNFQILKELPYEEHDIKMDKVFS